MFSSTKRWLRRNRTTLALGFGVLGAGYVATQYVWSKVVEAQERMSSDRIAKENLRRRFEQNQTDCTYTVLALLPTATENILRALPVEQITRELQLKRVEKQRRKSAGNAASELAPSEVSSGPPSAVDDDGRSFASFQSESYLHASQVEDSRNEAEQLKSRKSKSQLWHELKISSITRSFTLIYTLSLLALLTRIQLNLLGRRNYLSSVVSLASRSINDPTISLENHDDDNLDQAYGSDFEVNRRYLTFSWWLLHRGWKDIKDQVEGAVKDVIGPVSPRAELSLSDFSDLTAEIRRKVEGTDRRERASKSWLPFVLPPLDQEAFVLRESGMSFSQTSASQEASNASLRRLLDETSDLIESPPFSHVFALLLDSGFSFLVDTMLATQAFKLEKPSSTPYSHRSSMSDFDDVRNGYAAIENRKTAKAKLATILAVITRQAHAIASEAPNEYLQAMENVRDLNAFAAVVYSSNFEYEPPKFESSSRTDSANFGRTGSEVNETGDEGLIEAESLFENVWGKATEREIEEYKGLSY